ncbi:Phospholipid/glycerol acyltransferase domain-containing protein [[Candida] zeylanoides]
MLRSLVYDLVLGFFSLIVHTYFRAIESRGAHFIPKSGPVIFVIAPHANQFVDPFVVMTKVKQHSGRRISFLIAAKSMRRRFIGTAARLLGSIEVDRAQDRLSAKRGIIRVDASDPTVIHGEGTHFTADCMVKGLVGLPESLGNAQVASIESDTKLTLKKPFAKHDANDSEATEREQKIQRLLSEGTAFKAAPHVDNDVVFRHVFRHLNEGRVLGIFPEGGSHDRPSLLPLKAGVAIMALGAAAGAPPGSHSKINVIPVGLNYFHPHKFRSRAVVEFGAPIVVDAEMGRQYERDSRTSIGALLETITAGLNEVTVTCEDYDTMMALQAARRLYTAANREHIPISMVTEMNRRLVKGYQQYAHEPAMVEIKRRVSNYNASLRRMGLHDHQVESLTRFDRMHTLAMFAERLFKVVLFLGLSLPGVFLFSPVFIVGKQISRRKQREALAGSVVKIRANDVLATWKILVAMGLAPCLYVFYSVCGTVLLCKSQAVPAAVPTWVIFAACYGWSVLTTYASLRIGEIGVDYYKSLKPLIYSVLSQHINIVQIQRLKDERRELSQIVTEFCDTYGPGMFDDYNEFYRKYNKLSQGSEDMATPPKPQATGAGFFQGLADLDNLHYNYSLSDVPIFSRTDEDDEDAPETESKAPESQVRQRRQKRE